MKNLKKILSLGIGMYFVTVSVSKIFTFQLFLQTVYSFGVLPSSVILSFSICIILVELIGGVALILDVVPIFFSRMLFGTVILFTIAILINLIRGNLIDCGCYGTMVTTSISWWHVLHNVTLCSLLYGIETLNKRDAMPIRKQELE